MKQIICPWVGGERFTPEDQYQHLETKQLSTHYHYFTKSFDNEFQRKENSVMELQNSAWCCLELGFAID